MAFLLSNFSLLLARPIPAAAIRLMPPSTGIGAGPPSGGLSSKFGGSCAWLTKVNIRRANDRISAFFISMSLADLGLDGLGTAFWARPLGCRLTTPQLALASGNLVLDEDLL